MNVQKFVFLGLLGILVANLSSCAQTQSQSATAVAPTSTELAPPTPGTSDEEVMRYQVISKVTDANLKTLREVNGFINSLLKTQHDPTIETIVLTVKKDGFPVFLEGILRSNENLKRLPRSKTALVVLESERAPGVRNIFIEVPAKYLKDGKVSIYDWIPDIVKWQKYVDLKTNKLDDRSPEEAFLKLFWMGNKIKNPAFIGKLEKSGWKWPDMPRPDASIYIPIATETKGGSLK